MIVFVRAATLVEGTGQEQSTMMDAAATIEPFLPLFVVYGAFVVQGIALILGGAAVIKAAPPLPEGGPSGH